MGDFFNKGGGPTKGTKNRAEAFKTEAYQGRDQISQLIQNLLDQQLGLIGQQGQIGNAIGNNAAARAEQLAARGGQSLAPGAIDTSGQSGYASALPFILQNQQGVLGAQQGALQNAQAAQIGNVQQFLQNLFGYNQLLSAKKQPGFGAVAANNFFGQLGQNLAPGKGDIGQALAFV